jgi:heme exporter protein CcmD
MIPDLGKYAFEVSLAYLGSFAVIITFVIVSIAKHKQALKNLRDLEGDR